MDCGNKGRNHRNQSADVGFLQKDGEQLIAKSAKLDTPISLNLVLLVKKVHIKKLYVGPYVSM